MAFALKALRSTRARRLFAMGPAAFCHGACVRRGGTRTALCLRDAVFEYELSVVQCGLA